MVNTKCTIVSYEKIKAYIYCQYCQIFRNITGVRPIAGLKGKFHENGAGGRPSQVVYIILWRFTGPRWPTPVGIIGDEREKGENGFSYIFFLLNIIYY